MSPNFSKLPLWQVPLQTSDGLRLGALCSIDRVPRGLSPVQVSELSICAPDQHFLLLFCIDTDVAFDENPTHAVVSAACHESREVLLYMASRSAETTLWSREEYQKH
eukprot:5993856-Amphidinium_carterae.1